MLYLILLYTFTTVLCLWGGLIFYSIFHRINRTAFEISFQRPLFSYLLSGLILITALGQWIILFLPLNFFSLIGFILPLFIALSLLMRKTLTAALRIVRASQHPTPYLLPCFGIFLLMILLLNAGPTIMDDTDSYHIQMVKWAQEYGTVPGIANLHSRFGFNSSWFLSIAVFLPKINGFNGYMALNGLLSCWLSYYLLQKIFAVFSTPAPVSAGSNPVYAAIVMLLLCLIAWPMIRGNAASANYDFISTCCLIALFMETTMNTRVSYSEQPSSSAIPTPPAQPLVSSISPSPTSSSPAPSSRPILHPEWIVWPLYLGTVKLINFVLLLFCLLWLLRSFNRQTLLAYLSAASFILIPFGIRNILLSGYLLFPYYQLDLFSVDWKVSRSLVIEQMDYIKYFNRSNGDSEKVIGLPFFRWLPIWQHNLFLYDKVITDCSLACWLLVMARWKKLDSFSLPYRLFILALFIMLLTWLANAPDPRFIYGVLLAGIFFFIMTLPTLSSITTTRRWTTIFLLTLSTTLLAYTIRKAVTHPEYRNWTSTHPLPVPTVKKIKIDGIELQIPDKVLNNWNARCYDLELPCVYWINPYLRARGTTIRDGFRVDKDAGKGENKLN